MDYALPVSGRAIDYYIDARARVAFWKSSALHSPRQNQLLAALPDADYERVLPHLKLTQLPSGSMLHEAGGHPSFAYFPTAGIVSPFCVMKSGSAVAVAITGNEGVVGTSLLVGEGVTPNRVVVQSAGHAYRLSANRLRREFECGGYLCHLLLRYTQSLITQMAQTALCNRYHSIEQRLCRWLLLSLDRVTTNELSLTHELLSNILGVRRESVTQAAGKLQKAGVIRYTRGQITVLNLLELERRVCECYAVVKGEFGCSAGKTRLHAGVCVERGAIAC